MRKDRVCSVTLLLARVSLAPFFRIRVEGVENLPAERAFVLAPKHQRWEDIPLLGLATPRPLYYVAKHELFGNPLSSWYLSALGGIPLNRRRPLESRRSLRKVVRILQGGEGLVVFPEGTYYRDRMGPGHSGMVKLILSRLPLPFIPVGINYSNIGGRKSVRIRYGRPFYGDPSLQVEAFMGRLMGEIANLSSLQPIPSKPILSDEGERDVQT